jgi:16S rRNA (adenine1518-N6/adenine1519-N6)-dimethyltransferase
VLTRRLAATGATVTAIELDRDLIEELQALPVRVVHGDVLQVPPSAVLEPRPYKLAGNIPYYISSPILRHFLEAEPRPERAVLMLQKEFAERIVAAPGDMSLLSLSVQVYGQPTLLRTVPASAFRPRPKVDSALLRIDVYSEPAVPLPDPERFFAVARAGFAERRKQIHNALTRNFKPAGAHTRETLPPTVVQEVLEGCGVEPSRRAETLTLQEWACIAESLPDPEP